MGRTIVYTRPAARALARMPANTEALIREKLRTLADDPAALPNNIKALKGAEGFRLRIGDWRVIFTIEPDRVIVHAVGPRGSIYG
ncbi:type II toxin-antitoxin system RelE/ParE family toxin [Methylobacterium sp. 10]|uniref:type II toxin-antitoxin system RelE family toxin n=1 Tax=Methylobacterium sp. 10 TaxID=1101191 RepID=UPI0004BA65C8|nr:type II toxin-antitoxin system RelE/ParE family toxin [Methylobacterium sp. 10]